MRNIVQNISYKYYKCFIALKKGEIFLQSAAFLKQVLVWGKDKTTQDKSKALENKQLSMQISETLRQLECVEKCFDFETDSDMIDSLIFEHHALLARYRHLLILAKQENLSIAPKIS